MAAKTDALYATGRRKTAIARVWLMPGNGTININKRDIDNYFGRATSKMVLRQPLEATETMGRYDIHANVCGGGLAGQAEAIRHGITRCLMKLSPALRPVLKKAGYVTRDPRKKERKKYGQRGARARFQFSKR
jgi:small subunit ribosomal protein S9